MWFRRDDGDPQGLTYDANGNLTADGQRQFVWDTFGRLAQVKDAAGALVAAYRYDALGRRVRKDLYDTSGAIDKVIDEVWDGWRLIEEYEAASATVTPSLARWFAYGNGLDEPLMMHTVAGNTDHYYHQDALGSVAALTDNTGAVAESYEYDPYGTHVLIAGTTRTPNAPSALGNPFLYTGRHFDHESGLYYNRHRYYDPALGRFISTDPISYFGGINLYEYCGSQPANFTDPLGFDGWENSHPVLGMGAYRTINKNKEKFDADLVLKANMIVDEENKQYAAAYKLYAKNQNMSNTAVIGSAVAGKLVEEGMKTIPVWSPTLIVGQPIQDVATGNTHDIKQDLAPAVLYGAALGVGIFSALVGDGSAVSAETSNVCKVGPGVSEDLAKSDQAIIDADRMLPLLESAEKNPFHHIFPQRPDLAKRFADAGVDIDKFTLQMPKDLHIEIHSGGPRGGKWNKAWTDFFEANENPTSEEIYKKAGELIYEFKIPGNSILPYPKR